MSAKAGGLLVSANDAKRSYRHVTLGNGLDVLLVSDPETEKSSACCDVRVGSLQDPVEAPGLAHFLEHMLFMGTDKYPVENAYSAFLNEHGGSSNAYTAMENTVYYFDVLSDSLGPALDMFSSFFICPLFAPDSTDREINAVDSENSKNLQNDSWRFFQLFKSMAREDHPFNGFSTGNKATLGREGLATRDLCVAFHQKYYSANLMKVCIYGKEDLDTLEAWAAEKFLPIANKSVERPVVPADPFPPARVGRVVQSVPIKEYKGLSLFFPIPPVETLYRSKPSSYLAHLIGHEGGGSILSALKAAGLANGLSAYTTHDTSSFAAFCVSVDLTDRGVECVDAVVAAVFAYIGVLKREGPQDWIAQEMQDTRAMDFRFLNASDPIDYTVYLANNMQTMQPEHYVAGEKLLIDKDPALSASFLDCLRPDNLLLFVRHKGLAGHTDKQERWYGTDYSERALTPEELALWAGCVARGAVPAAAEGAAEGAFPSTPLALPRPNDFIPTDFGLKVPLPSDADAADAGTIALGGVGGAASSSSSSGSGSSSSSNSNAFLEAAPSVLADGGVSMAEILAAAGESKEAEAGAEGGDKGEKEAAPEGEGEGAGDEEEEGDEEGDEEGEEEEGGKVAMPQVPSRSVLLFHKPDLVWRVPKVNCTALLESPAAFTCPLGVALCELFAACLTECLSEYSYYADCAGLWYQIYPTKGGLQVAFSGFSHKMPLLVQKFASEMARMCRAGEQAGAGEEGCVPAALFDRMKEKLMRQWANHRFYTPYQINSANTSQCLEEPKWSAQDKMLAASQASLRDLSAFAASLLWSMRAVVLVHGNADQATARALADIITNTLASQPMPDTQQVHRRTVRLQPATRYTLRSSCLLANAAEPNSCVSNAYYWPLAEAAAEAEAEGAGEVLRDQFVRVEAMLELLVQILAEPAFDQLRTKEQLGYIVWTRSHYSPSFQYYLSCIVQSSHKGPEFLDARVEAFLLQHYAVVAALTPEGLAVHTQATIDKLLERPKNLDEETRRHWGEIQDGRCIFDMRPRCCAVLRAVTVDEVAAAYRAFLLPSPERIKWSAHFFGKGHHFPTPASSAAAAAAAAAASAAAAGVEGASPPSPAPAPFVGRSVIVTDPAAFKRASALLPVLDPFAAFREG